MRFATCRLPERKRMGRFALVALLACAAAGCQTGASDGPAHTGSIGSSAIVTASDLTPDQALQAVQKWGAAYGRNEKDKAAALNYAAALRAAGETKQGVAVMRKAAIYHPNDREVLAGFGKALAADGQFREALETVRRAQRSDNPDWQLLAAEGGILDSLGDHQQARDRYRQALVLAPGEPQVLNNLGMSFVLTNELDRAEEALGQAAANPRATLKIRQNYALVQQLKAGGGARPAAADAAALAPAGPGGDREQDTWAELAASG